jgi:hypothetical protein
MKYTPMRCTPVRYTPIRYALIRYALMRCTPIRYNPITSAAKAAEFDLGTADTKSTYIDLRDGSGERFRVRVQGWANSRAGYFAHKSFYNRSRNHCEVHASKVYASRMHACEVYAYETHTHEVCAYDAYKLHAHEMNA